MRQIFEKYPEAETLQAAFDLLRLENAAMKLRLATLEKELLDKATQVETVCATAEKQQEVIDLLNSEIVMLRRQAPKASAYE